MLNVICVYRYRQCIQLTPNKSFVFQANFTTEDINHICGAVILANILSNISVTQLN